MSIALGRTRAAVPFSMAVTSDQGTTVVVSQPARGFSQRDEERRGTTNRKCWHGKRGGSRRHTGDLGRGSRAEERSGSLARAGVSEQQRHLRKQRTFDEVVVVWDLREEPVELLVARPGRSIALLQHALLDRSRHAVAHRGPSRPARRDVPPSPLLLPCLVVLLNVDSRNISLRNSPRRDGTNRSHPLQLLVVLGRRRPRRRAPEEGQSPRLLPSGIEDHLGRHAHC